MYEFLKRILDIFGSMLGLIVLLPLFLMVCFAIKLDSQGPIFADTPMRVGRNGRLFKMYKFRSMVANAHELLRNDPKFQQLYEKYKKGSYKLFDDPRITNVGKFIRRYSVDELPQFINVLRGDMSLVGPRAYYPDELEDQQIKYPSSRKFVKIILSGKPGITGVWQVSGRSEINFDKRVEMDASYIQKRSTLFDILILLKTIPAVLTGRGAI